jgi:hypothetical protein
MALRQIIRIEGSILGPSEHTEFVNTEHVIRIKESTSGVGYSDLFLTGHENDITVKGDPAGMADYLNVR